MKKVFTVLFLYLIVSQLFAQSSLQSPKEFLGYELGARFTRHHRVVEYFKHVADVMPNVSFQQYGETYEHRPLVYVVVTSPENFKNLDQIRQDNLKRAGAMEGTAAGDKKAIVWLSYNVHGNEANSLEASMWTLYDLANPANGKSQEWLKNTVVIIDPCINPDGRDRYANYYNQYGNTMYNASPDAKEHREPWPGGRANHYWFDLNRDWAWLQQQESQQRIAVYNQWLPHVHVDFHEQGHNSPYYFAPAAEPLHEMISDWQRQFQVTIGKNHAKYFDAQGWLYFTKESFDLFYPSYGDSYPIFSGAIGMTYEQAGGGFAGLGIRTETGDTLTLRDRLTHHYTTGMSTVEVSSQNANRVVDEFEKYYRDNLSNPPGAYKTYIIKADNNADKLARLAAWMDSHGIKYGHPAAGKATRGYDFSSQNTGAVSYTTQDIVVNTFQSKSRFITTVFEPTSKLSDSVTYDITAWNLMYAYGLKGYALTERINPARGFTPPTQHVAPADKPYAYILKYQTLEDVAFVASLLNQGVKLRAAKTPFTISGENFAMGTVLALRGDNKNTTDFDTKVKTTAKAADRRLYTSTTGFVDKGKDFGSGDMMYLKAPRIATLVGDQTSSLSAGEVWHFFEQQIHYPVTQIGTDYFRNVDMSAYDVLIVPSGYYRMFDESTLADLGEWVSGGGRLILVSNAVAAFADKKGFGLTQYASEEEKRAAEKKEEAAKQKEGLLAYKDAERFYIQETIAGAIYKVTLDTSHPLAYGMTGSYYTLKTGELYYSLLQDDWNVGRIAGKARPVQGFSGHKINAKLDNTVIFGVEEKGGGTIIYMVDNPLFRCFWEEGKMIFANAVFMVGNN